MSTSAVKITVTQVSDKSGDEALQSLQMGVPMYIAPVQGKPITIFDKPGFSGFDEPAQ
jgi:hypothetical protein